MAEVDWGDQSVKIDSGRGEIKKFYLEDGETARFVLIDEKAFLTMSHYDKEIRRYVRCIKDEHGVCPGCDKIGPPKQRFGANVIRYKTDRSGNVLDPVDFEILLWTFGADKFAQVRAIKQEWGDLRAHDLKAICSNKQFQELVITPLPKAVWLEDDELKARVAEVYQSQKYDLNKVLGKLYSVDEMKNVLAGKKPDGGMSSTPTLEQSQEAIASIEKELELETKEGDSKSEDLDFDSILEGL